MLSSKFPDFVGHTDDGSYLSGSGSALFFWEQKPVLGFSSRLYLALSILIFIHFAKFLSVRHVFISLSVVYGQDIKLLAKVLNL